MHLLDWILVGALLLVLTTMAIRTARYAQSVSGFLAANRCAGRYLISIAFNMAQLGVITLVWYFQQNYDVGYTSIWWGLLEGPALIVIALTGWVIYRFRRTRALTLAEFFERRYSRNFRVFAGVVAFGSGLLNYGIFPGVAARFFKSLCGLPDTFMLGEHVLSTTLALMSVLMAFALFFVFLGGQVAVMVTDFVQGVFSNIVFFAVVVFFLWWLPWEHVSETLMGQVWKGEYAAAPEGKSLIHPFKLEGEEQFNPLYWLISAVVLFYGMRAWQGDQGYNASALNAHEAKMANILNGWRFRVMMLIVLIVPIGIRTVLHHPEYAVEADVIHAALNGATPDGLDGDGLKSLQSELRTPLSLATLLPTGLLGLFCAAMLGAFISTNDTYLHSWGTIFVQDVVLPFRKKPLSARAHLWLLRSAIFGVAVFAMLFSWWYKPTEYIAMFLALTGAIFVGGAGAVTIGGLYWRRGTTQAAWTAMIIGLTASTYRIVVKQDLITRTLDYYRQTRWEGFVEPHLWVASSITGQEMTGIVIVLCIVSYVVVSFTTCRSPFNLDQLLHRGAYETDADRSEFIGEERKSWLAKLGFTREFTGTDRWITWITLAWPLAWTLAFVVFTIYNHFVDVSDQAWLTFWRIWTWFTLGVGVAVLIWFTIGGFRDLRRLFARLRAFRADTRDDGQPLELRREDAASSERPR